MIIQLQVNFKCIAIIIHSIFYIYFRILSLPAGTCLSGTISYVSDDNGKKVVSIFNVA